MNEKLKVTVGNEYLLNLVKDASPNVSGINVINVDEMNVNFETGDIELSLKKDEKFGIKIMGNSVFTLDIFNQYELKVSKSFNIDSIAVHVGSYRDNNKYITLLGNYTKIDSVYANTLDIKDFTYKELAELIVTMVKLYHPKEIKLDTCGMGTALLDELNVEFKKENIHYGDNGVLEYDYKQKEINYKKIASGYQEALERISGEIWRLHDEGCIDLYDNQKIRMVLNEVNEFNNKAFDKF